MASRQRSRRKGSSGCGAKCQLAVAVAAGGGASLGITWQLLHEGDTSGRWPEGSKAGGAGGMGARPPPPPLVARPAATPASQLSQVGGGMSGDSSPSQPARGQPEKYNVYTFWNYPNGPGPLVKLNLETWRKHLPAGTQIVFINDTNYQDLVPDAPEEFFRLPDSASRSDAIRASVLYHHGGLYMDTDFIAMRSLEPVFSLLKEGWDIVTYTDAGGPNIMSGACMTGPLINKSFSSNFMAARRGNSFSKTWWENIKAKLTRMCAHGEWINMKTCCHWAFNPEKDTKKCNLPWAFLEHLKIPQCDDDLEPRPAHFCPFWKLPFKALPEPKGGPGSQEVIRQVELGNRFAIPFTDWSRVYCLAGNESLTPHLNGEIYWQHWNTAVTPQATINITAPEYDKRFECVEQDGGDVYCPFGNWAKQRQPRNHKNFFGRMAHHLFFSNQNRKNKIDVKTVEEIWNTEWLLTEMYRRSLGLIEMPHRSVQRSSD